MNKGKFYWNRKPGLFLKEETGEEFEREFHGNVQEWYQTLYEVIISADVKLMDGQTAALVCGVDIGTILEHLVQFRPSMGPARPGRHTVYVGTLGRFPVFFSTSDSVKTSIRLVTVSNEDFAEVEVKGMGIL